MGPKSVAVSDAVKLEEFVPMDQLQLKLSNIYQSRGSLEWAWRKHREQFISGGAVFEIAGRLLAHPATFARVALEIGADRLARRHRDSVTSTA
jgi:hypothetical protein